MTDKVPNSCPGALLCQAMSTLITILTLVLLLSSCTPTPEPAPSTKEASPMALNRSSSGHDLTPLDPAVHAKLVRRLSPESFEITQREGTEPPGCGLLLDNKEDGTYCCVVCGLPLFSSEHKFTSGTGWPSFFAEFDPAHVTRHEDTSHGMVRTEIECARCQAHLGHVFPDGPPPTGERHCLNSASLTFHPKGTDLPDLLGNANSTLETAYFAGGCFWGIEHYLQKGPGVIDAESGYMQGDDTRTDYQSVCTGTTGHAETVKVVFDPAIVSFRTLSDAFLRMHDPTQLNRQGPDRGTQYRSGIWTTNDAQAQAAAEAIQAAQSRYDRPIVTEVAPAQVFYPAETYHQDYIARTGRMCHVVDPWQDATSFVPAH